MAYWFLSDYENVVELNDPNSIDPNASYHFCIFITGDVEYVIIHDISEVDEFDNNM